MGIEDYKDMSALVDRVVQRSRNILKEKRRKRNIAALVDFASNLLVTAGNSKGVGITYAKQQFPKYENEYRNASERLGKHMRDFSGRVARARVWNPLTGKGAEKTDVTTSGSLRLSSGSFKRALESFDRSSGFNKMF
ncbi:MAG: hypothetical protein IKU76_05095 [Bacteroidaceae bacterium]|nr:hypothetical protein [Bacteroidaceae bacterium]